MTVAKNSTVTAQTPSNAHYNKALLNDGAFGDCTVICRHRSWRAHRNILSPRCHFFHVCFNGNFRESFAGSNEVRMDDDDPTAVEGLLQYLYTLEYPADDGDLTGSNAGVYEAWKRDFKLFEIADKYMLPEMMRLARSALVDRAEPRHSEVFMKSLDGFAGLVDELYDADKMASESVRELRVEVLGGVAETVARNVRDPRLAELVAVVPDFAVDLIEALGNVRRDREVTLPGAPSRGSTPPTVYIPLNEDSDSECD